MGYKATKDLHIVEVKVRLTERFAEAVEAYAKFNDLPLATAARLLMQKGATSVTAQAVEGNTNVMYS